MEWMVPVNEMLKEDITKLNYTLIPPGFQGDVRSVRVMQESLSRLIDALGAASAAAQGLNKVITTADKLRNAPAHTLYLLKDADAKGGKGDVIGLLKVGRKHLFLFDARDKVVEVEPLCVLDFFVLRDRQRHGHGRALFDHMLRDMATSAEQLAIDGPSSKMERFLAKNYGVSQLVRQNNNFAVSPAFFGRAAEISPCGRQMLAHGKKRVELAAPASAPALAPAGAARSASGRSPAAPAQAVGRFAAHKPPSAIANVIHGGGGGPHYETNNGRASGAATPDAERALAEGRTPPPRSPDLLPLSLPELEHKLEQLELEVETRPSSRPTSLPVGVPAAAAGAAPPPPAPPAPAAAAAPSPAGSTISRRDSQLTERGFFDVKFYHNKLW